MYVQLTPTYRGKGKEILFGPFTQIKTSPEGIDANYEERIFVKLLYNETTQVVHYDGKACTLEIITEKELERRDINWKAKIIEFNPSARSDVN